MTAGSPRRFRGSGAIRRKGRRGVSEVVATIILLALTVTLFAAIFAWVNTFPAPPAQNSNQFQATLTTGTNTSSSCTTAVCKTVVLSLNILHLAGPAVSGYTSTIYLKSANHPLGPEFTTYKLWQGGIANGTVWNLGQTWSLTFKNGFEPVLPDNLTVYVINSNQLLFSVVLPGQGFTFPPTFVAESVTPAQPSIGETFTVYATLTGTITTNSVYADLVGIPGFTSSGPTEMTLGTNGVYSLSSSGIGTSTTSGTYYAIFNASNSAGQATTGALSITIYPVNSGGGSSTATLSLSPVQDPSPVSSAYDGGTITAVGAGFSSSTTVALTLNGATVTLSACSAGTLQSGDTSVAPTSGGFSCTFYLPVGLAAGTYTIFASSLSSSQTASALFLVTTPALSSPTSGSTLTAGNSESVAGTGFTVSGSVKVHLDYTASSGTLNTTECTITVSSTGTISCSFTVPTPKSDDTSATFSVEDISTGRWISFTVTI